MMQLEELEPPKQIVLPRVNQEFIGIGHELENHKRLRKKIAQDQKIIENRVLHLQKEKIKAFKKIEQQKKKLEEILSVKERQQLENEEKNRLRQLRQLQLQQLKRQNQQMRKAHKANLESQIKTISFRNNSDYSRIRQARIDGEYKKKVERNKDLSDKKDHWISLNISKEKGKMKVDKFYKKKNKEHLQFYKSRIEQEDNVKSQKINRIKQLEAKEGKLREQLQNTTMKASRMIELIDKANRTLSPMDTRSIEAELYLNQANKKSRKTLGISERQSTTVKDKSFSNLQDQSQARLQKQQIEENIELSNEDTDKSGFRVIHKRKKNKHMNRYKQYEAF